MRTAMICTGRLTVRIGTDAGRVEIPAGTAFVSVSNHADCNAALGLGCGAWASEALCLPAGGCLLLPVKEGHPPRGLEVALVHGAGVLKIKFFKNLESTD